MRVEEEEGLAEKAKAEELIAEVSKIDGVEYVTVELGDDWSGDPAMWLVFHLQKDLPSGDDSWMELFLEYSGLIQTKILQSDLGRFPYKRLERVA